MSYYLARLITSRFENINPASDKIFIEIIVKERNKILPGAIIV